MESIRLRNIRSLADTGQISLKPITLLLGQNSSGKSTVLRTLPLLLQSIRTRSNAPILWYGDLVDFGSVREVRSTFALDQAVQFEISLGKIDVSRRGLIYEESPTSDHPKVKIKLDLVDVEGKTRLKSFDLRVGTDKMTVELDGRGAVSNLIVNSLELTRLLPSEKYKFSTTELVPQLVIVRGIGQSRTTMYSPYGRLLDTCEREIKRFFTENLSGRTSEETINGIMRRIPYQPGGRFTNRVVESTAFLASGKLLAKRLTAPGGAEELNRLRSLYFVGSIPEVLGVIERVVTRTFGNVSYVGPSRATGERYYRMQELAVDQIDPQGRNLAMFLHSLSSLQQGFFSDWLLEAMGYAIRIEKSAGHIQIHLREENSEKFYNIADMGYGFSQVLPIMAQVWSRQTRSWMARQGPVIVAMEQPELHLHPAYQARLANVFCRSIARQSRPNRTVGDLRFVIETHSESLINRLGTLVYEGKVSPDDIAIYIFEKSEDSGITRIRTSSFETDGTLSNWPIGFFSAIQA